MAFEPENQLEKALLSAATDVLARPAFYRFLMSEPLIVAGEIVRGGAEGEGMNLAVVRYNGRAYHPIFSAFSRLQTLSKTKIPHFGMIGRDLFARTRGADFVLNPGSSVGKQLSPSEIAYWLDPAAREALSRNPPQARLGLLPEPPPLLIEALCILFQNRHEIVAARLLQVAFSDRNEPPHPLVVIETDGAWEKTAREISELSAAILPELLIDLIRFDRANPDPGLAPLIAQTQPFYQRTATE